MREHSRDRGRLEDIVKYAQNVNVIISGISFEEKRIMRTKTILTALLVLVAMAGRGQTMDTIRVGMEMKLQNVISTNVFLMHRETTPMKGLPSDTASFHLYENIGILCALGKGDTDGTYFVSIPVG